jgi:hypothetical protein
VFILYKFIHKKSIFRSEIQLRILTLDLTFVSLLFFGASLPEDRLFDFSFLKCNTSTDGYCPFLGDSLILFTISTDHHPYD